ncbi:BRO1 domain-containing protein BROX-like isoform X2 [Pollicipes pollicipes]|uniref:BRO1 domain-containing protein BROX-like isoform X2 n=1 Tax=Pollicipes pollicipes TaxID=41117 RepID=UPI0018850E72|nr:BRO1 domain-containing protein BROX-like isoform X2 [Pollicipes pollicipes]XP_037089570.1 BRO1 domain-containing protein BROX-like isoform X2 [Pollicipes pollicipes]
MSHWFHRNGLKATGHVNFDLKLFASEPESLKICSELRQARHRLLELLPDAGHQCQELEAALNSYLALLTGFLQAPDQPDQQSKLRHVVRFRWTHTLLGNTPEAQKDAVFEVICICQNVAVWYMKRAAKIAGKEDITMEDGKEVHSSLRRAAGLMKAVHDRYIGQLLEESVKEGDCDTRVITAYMNQCTAEAQEVTIARAIELKHSPGLVSALAHETSGMFQTAADSLRSMEPALVQRWTKYLQLKAAVYKAYAYNYLGENFLADDKCGEAIRCLKESQKFYTEAGELCKEYADAKGVGAKVKPEKHLFFRKLGPILNRTLEKCERENGFIYHQKVPYDAPALELRDNTYGLVAPDEFAMPAPAPLWTAVSYAAFDVSKLGDAGPSAAEKAEGDLPPVKEVKDNHTDQDPKNHSGCVVA